MHCDDHSVRTQAHLLVWLPVWVWVGDTSRWKVKCWNAFKRTNAAAVPMSLGARTHTHSYVLGTHATVISVEPVTYIRTHIFIYILNFCLLILISFNFHEINVYDSRTQHTHTNELSIQVLAINDNNYTSKQWLHIAVDRNRWIFD